MTRRLHPCLTSFEELDGIEVLATASTTSYHVISALVPVDRLLEAIMVPEVAAAYGAANSTGSAGYAGKSQGSADNMAEEALDIDDLRRVFSWADGDGIEVGTLNTESDIDTLEFSTNNQGATTISLLESHAEMDPMMILFQQLFEIFIDVDYNSGAGDDARLEIGAALQNYPYTIEVLSESSFAGSANFNAVIDAPDQTLISRTAYLDGNGYDAGYSGSLGTIGNTNYITYTCPSTGSLFIGLHPDGFLGYIRLYDEAGDLVDQGIVADGFSGGLSVDAVTAGETYAIQIVSWGYSGIGDYDLTADFGSNHLFSDDFESGSTSRWSSVAGN